jgi:hypothetical protein
MADTDGAQRKMRLRPEVLTELAGHRTQLHTWVKLGILTADGAMEAYGEILARVVRNPACMMVDDGTGSPVRCRECGRTTSVPLGLDWYACRCQPSLRRALATDLVNADGSYAVDPFALPVGA